MKKICFILFLFISVTSYSQTFWYPVWLKSTVKMTGIPGTGTLLGIDINGDVTRVTGGGGVSGLTPDLVLFGKSDGTIDQSVDLSFTPSEFLVGNLAHLDLGAQFGGTSGSYTSIDAQGVITTYYNTAINDGDILYGSGGGMYVLPMGSANQSIRVNAGGTNIEWFTPTYGEVNTASNLGGGLANFDSKSGVDLRFNSFLASDFNLASNLISLDYANAQKTTTSTIGFLTDTDWDTFNDKVSFDIHSQSSEISLANDDETPIYDLSEGAINKTTYETLLSPNPTNYRNYRFTYFNEFLNTVGTATGGNDIIATNSGTGAGTNNTATNAAERVGLVRSTTGTTATGRTSPGTSSTACAFGGGSWTYEIEINLAALSSVTQRYQLVLGFHDVQNAANQIDAIAFVYDEGGVSTGSAASANWQTLTSSNSTRTWTTSGTAVATGWVNLRIEVNAAASSVSFYVNGTSVATHTTNIPSGGGRYAGFGYLLLKSIGTTASTMDVDYIFCEQDLTTNR